MAAQLCRYERRIDLVRGGIILRRQQRRNLRLMLL